MLSRILKAARFDGDTFRELRDDPSATGQSVLLVGLVAACYGLAFGFYNIFLGAISNIEFVVIVLTGLLGGVGLGFVWSGTTFLAVTRLFKGKIRYWQLARPFFFSWSPGLLFVFVAAPFTLFSELIFAIGSLWIVLASVFAVKHAVGFSIQHSMLAFIVSVLAGILVLIFIQSLAGT